MTIKKLTRVSNEALKNINMLLVQLRDDLSGHKAKLANLRDMVKDKRIALIVVRDGKRIVGMATLYVLQKLGKRVARIEDVIIDTQYRGKGLGTKLIQVVIATARAQKAQSLQVNSRPVHVVGNKLYRKIGFRIKETNVYRMKL